jgi:IPT/TIG domain-containing protein
MKAQALRTTLAIAALAAALLAGCTSDESPTAPPTGSSGVQPGGSSGNAGAWVVTVTASPNTVHTQETTPSTELSTIVVNVRNSTTGAPPPDGSTVVLIATGGTLGGAGATGATTSTRTLFQGQATDTFTANPSATNFTATVRATFAASSGQVSIQVIASGAEAGFAITGISPNVGDPAGGIEAIITGNQIQGIVKVLFGSNAAQVLSTSPTRIRVRVPALGQPVPVGGTVPVTVSVTNDFGTTNSSSDSIPNGFIYANGASTEVPVIFTIDPTTGPQEGNTPIVISGSHFVEGAHVIFRFAGIDLQAATSLVTSTRIEAVTPDLRPYIQSGQLNSPFQAQVVVQNPNGASGTFGGQFTYGTTIRITSITPGAGTYLGGTHVLIHGNGFDEPVAVTLGGIGQAVVSVSGTEVQFITAGLSGNQTPACNGQTNAVVGLTNLEGGASATGPSFTYIGPPNPTILNINPSFGVVGDSTTISGSNFQTPLRVLFGGSDGANAPITAQSSTSVTVTVPTPPPSFTFLTQACDGNGDNVAGGTRNQPTPISITVLNLTSGCDTTLTNAFTLMPCGGTPSAPIVCPCVGDTSTPPPTTVQCNDGFDNDGDTLIDAADPQCTGPTDNDESS